MAPHLHTLTIVLRAATTRHWIAFAGCLLLVFVLDWAEALLLPIAVALLLTFLLNPPVSVLQRWIRRGPAVVRRKCQMGFASEVTRFMLPARVAQFRGAE